MKYLTMFLAAALFLFLTTLQAAAKSGAGPAVGCDIAGCHAGIEPTSPTMDFGCTICHKGNGNTKNKRKAHEGMYANPGDLRVVNETCGICHGDVVQKAMKSLHATSAGVISGTRWAWAAQDIKNAIYANMAVTDNDGDIPAHKGALAELQKIPMYDPSQPESFTNSPADDYLRNQCLRCHLWSGGHERDGDWRASGCSACHVVYSDSGLYEGSDPTVDKTEKGHPIKHEITTKIPEFQCIHCHNRGGRTGVSFIGTMEADNYGSPWTETGEKQPKLHDKWYNHLNVDCHFEQGMTCIDCHTMQDLHGDGNIYSKKEQAVEIECEDCHGTIDAESTLMTSWGNPLENLEKRDDGSIVLTTKLYGQELLVGQIKDIDPSSDAGVAMKGISRHLETMECYACHGAWAPQCYGCHAKQDLGKTGRDWVDPVPHPTDPSKTATKAQADASQIAKGWSENRSYLRWETPVFGINADSEGNKVAPFVPGCQVIFTQIGADGAAIVHNKVFTAPDGNSGISQNPIQPHTITEKPRICEDCHNTDKALGLGSGIYDSFANGLNIDFELERIVDEEGNQIQTTNHVGARPFNKEEMDRMRMDTTCIICHTTGVP